MTFTQTASRSPKPAERAFELQPRPPFRLDLTAWALGRRAQNAIDTWDGRSYRRALLVDGAPLELAVTQVGGASTPRLEVVLSGPHVTSSAEEVARSTLARLLGLDVDLSGFYARAARDSLLGERRFLVGTEPEDDPDAALVRWAPDAGLAYFHLLLRGLARRVGAGR